MRLIDATAVVNDFMEIAMDAASEGNALKSKTFLMLADIVSQAPTEPQWIPFTRREPTAEEKAHHPDWVFVWDCELPEDGQEILVSNGKHVWKDEWVEADYSGLESGSDIDDDCAWMPMPEPYRRDNNG